MKKILRLSTMFALLVCICLGFAACEPALEKIHVDLDTIKTEYYVGEAQETYENAKVYAIYENGDQKPIDNEDITFSTISTAEIGTQTLTITYKGKSQEVSITVREKQITAISVTGLKTSYVIDEAQDNTCTVTATYEDGSTSVVPFSELTFSTISTTEVGPQTITITYKGISKYVEVYVNEKAISRIEIDEESIFTEHYYGDIISEDHYTEAVVTVYYEDGTDEEVYFDDLTFSEINTTPADITVPQILTITYKGVSTTVEVTIKERVIESIEIVETDLSLSYNLGETVDYSNLKININYTNGTSDENVAVSGLSNVDLTIPTTDTIGTKILKVEYKGFEDLVYISVTEKEIKTLTLNLSDTDYIKGVDSTFPSDKVSVTITYTDDSSRVITSDNASFADINFTGLDLTKSGYQTLEAEYKNTHSNPVDVTVYSSIYDTYYISEYSAPSFVVKYRKNIEENTNEELDYFTKDAGYVVGDDNPFKFLPNITGYAPDANESTPISQYKSLVEVWEWVWYDAEKKAGDFVKLTGDISSKVIIDDENSTLDFTEASVGKTYRISVLPYFDRELPAITFEFTVQDGWNVYDAKELSLMDNMNLTETDSKAIDYQRLKDGIWTAFKEENGLSGIEVNGLFLHSDLTITADDVSSLFFYHPGDVDYPSNSDAAHKDTDGVTPLVKINGSLRDYSNIYKRQLNADQPFTFNGNYFNINTDSFPLISVYKGEGISNGITHSSLFWTEGDGIVNFSNVTFFGNAQRTEGIEHSGGLILFKLSDRTTANIDNTIARAFCITYFPEYGTVMSINKCKSYDNFSTFIWSYGETHCNITNSYFMKCGGPIAILAHYDPDKSSDQFGNFEVDSDSILENFVTTQEAWFSLTGSAGMITRLAPLEKAINTYSQSLTGTSKSFITTNENGKEVINFVALIMHCEGPQSSSSNQIEGTFKIEGTSTADDSGINMTTDPDSGINMTTDPSTADPIYQKILNASSIVPILQAGGKTIYTDGERLLTIDETTGQPRGLNASEAAFFADNYIGVSVPLGNGSGRTGILFGVFEKETSES